MSCFRLTVLPFGTMMLVTEVAMRTPGWTHADETADTLPCPADEHADAERWVDMFLAQMRDADTVIAVLLATDLATAGDA